MRMETDLCSALCSVVGNSMVREKSCKGLGFFQQIDDSWGHRRGRRMMVLWAVCE